MAASSTHDPNRKWRRAWRACHSPLVLLPTVLTCTAAAAADVAEAIPRFGWVIGVVFAILVLMGTLITLADLVPHLIKWLRSGHARFSAMLARAGNGLDKFADRITDIISDR